MRDRRRYFARVFEAKKPSGQMVARESRWSEAVAVGSLSFVNTVKSELGFKAAHQPRCGGSTVQGFKSTK